MVQFNHLGDKQSSEEYDGPFQTFMMELLCKNNWLPKTIIYSCKINYIIDL